jgi:hypothetical protein
LITPFSMRIEPRLIPELDTYLQSRSATEASANYLPIPTTILMLNCINVLHYAGKALRASLHRQSFQNKSLPIPHL